MGKSIMELERSLHRTQAAPARKTAAQRTEGRQSRPDPCVPASHAVTAKRKALAQARSYGLGRSGRAHAFNAIDVTVSGTVGPLQQRNFMTCWATVYTMLVNWKNQRSEAVETAIAAVGSRWSALLAQGDKRGLNAAEKVDFLADAGLVAIPPQNPTLQRWADMLKDYGPLWVTTDEAPPNLMIHARLLIAMKGDGTADGTKLTLINPASGGTDTESFTAFLRKFEAEAANPKGALRVQIVHWPAGAKAFSFAKEAPGALPPNLLGGTARRALIAALTSRGVMQMEAEQLVGAFEAEVLANNSRPIPLGYRPAAFDTPKVPAPEDGDPKETAKEILQFFYPERSLSPMNNDHVRLAARMFYSALEKQKAINLLPEVPTTPPGPSWLAKQAIKILWRQVSGPKGIMVAVRNTVALQWRTTLDEIENGLPPTALSFRPAQRFHALSYVEQQGLSDWINNPDIPLSPAVGGRSLDHAALDIGDLIVSTTTEAPSIAIRRIGSPVSHIMLYVGGGMVVEAVGDGVVHRTLADALAHSYVGVAFRHPAITPDQALQVRDFVGQQIGKKYDYDLIVAHARFQLGKMVCEQLPANMRDRCTSIVGPVDIGRGGDSKFICSSLVAEAFASVGLPLLPIPARGTTPGDIAMNANLVYLGHVKYDPPAGLLDRVGRM